MNVRIKPVFCATSLLFAIASTGCGPEELGAEPVEGLSEVSQAACYRPTTYPWQQPVYSQVKTATTLARDQICDAYVSGAVGPDAFDCSGLAYYVYRNAGFPVFRTNAQGIYNAARDQSGGAWGSLVGEWEKRPGDLIFYGLTCQDNSISHVAIYMGVNLSNNKPEMVHALNPSSGVVLSGVDGTTGLCKMTRVARVKY
ncbi:MAG TPA: NlpC/P60 family protein [Archangium sp.]|nr:NlpC/P60 family protein [Archangium sp.]